MCLQRHVKLFTAGALVRALHQLAAAMQSIAEHGAAEVLVSAPSP